MEMFACGGHLLAHKTTSSALNSQFQSAMKKLPKKSTFITKSFLDHSTSKNCQNLCLQQANLLAHKTTSSALNSQFQSAMKKLPQMSTFITKSFLDHFTSKNCQNFSPAASIYWLIKLPVLLLTPSFKVP